MSERAGERRETRSWIEGGCEVVWRQHPETGMVQRVHLDGTHHMPSLDPRCGETREEA